MKKSFKNLFGLLPFIAASFGSENSALRDEMAQNISHMYPSKKKYRKKPSNYNSNKKAKARNRNRASDLGRTIQRRYK